MRGRCSKQGKAEEGEEQEQAETEKEECALLDQARTCAVYTLIHESKYKAPPSSQSASQSSPAMLICAIL